MRCMLRKRVVFALANWQQLNVKEELKLNQATIARIPVPTVVGFKGYICIMSGQIDPNITNQNRLNYVV